jgi:hypothetical protein
MSIENIPNIKLIPATHRCHPFALDFVVALAAVGRCLSLYHGRPVTTFGPTQTPKGLEYQNFSISGLASGKTIAFVPHDVLQSVLVAENRSVSVAYLEQSTFPELAGVTTSAMAETIEGFAQAMFTRYWETNLAGIEAAHGLRREGKWPQVLQFGAIVRDAMSHGGRLHMFPGVPAATYFGLTYTDAQNGRRIIHNDLTTADLFLLMLAVDAAF